MNLIKQGLRRPAPWSDDRFYFALLSAMTLLVALLVTMLGLDLNRNFATIACDTAAYQSALVNTLHGHWFRDSAYDGPNILGQHSVFVLLLIAPVYLLYPSVETLFTLQIIGVYSTVIPLYLVARELLGRPLSSFLVAATALASPLLLHMAVAPFHPESWILPAVLWSYFFYRRNESRGFWLGVIGAFGCGEQAALIYVSLGISLWWLDDGIAWRKRYGRWALGAGLGWLLFTLGVLFPIMHHPQQINVMAYHYSQWNVQSAPGLASALVRHPFETIGLLASPLRWAHVAALVGLPIVLAFTSWRSLWLLAPFPPFFLMCDQEFFLYFHAYYFQFAFFAGYLGLLLFLSRWDIASRAGTTVLASALLLNVLTLCTAASLYLEFADGNDEAFSNDLHAVFATLPADAAVYSPHRYSAYLSNRPNMVMGDLRDENLDFNAMLDAKFSTTNVHPEQIDYIVCDLINDQCGWRQGGYNPVATQMRVTNFNRLVQTGQWRVYWNQNDVVILQRVGK